MGVSLFLCIADLNESQNADQSLTSLLNLGNISLGSHGFDGVTEGGSSGSCDAVEGGRGTCEIVGGGSPPPIGVDAINNSIFCLPSITFATLLFYLSFDSFQFTTIQNVFIHFLQQTKLSF